MIPYIHPDYNADELLATDFATQSPLFAQTLADICKYIAADLCSDFGDEQVWLATLLINGKAHQVKLVVTDANFIDED